MLTTRHQAAAVLLPNHNVLVSGGINDVTGSITSSEIYNGEVWTKGPEIPDIGYGHCMLYVSGYVFIIGGASLPLTSTSHVSDTYSYNLDTGLWMKKAI